MQRLSLVVLLSCVAAVMSQPNPCPYANRQKLNSPAAAMNVNPVNPTVTKDKVPLSAGEISDILDGTGVYMTADTPIVLEFDFAPGPIYLISFAVELKVVNSLKVEFLDPSGNEVFSQEQSTANGDFLRINKWFPTFFSVETGNVASARITWFSESGEMTVQGMRIESCCQAIDCFWTPWSDWGDCSVTCGESVTSRSRMKVEDSCPGADCEGDDEEFDTCDKGCCPVDCFWTLWSDWGDCSVTCGESVTSRSRMKVADSCPGADCEGDDVEFEICDSGCCPVDCRWNEWGPWNDCSTTCGDGERTRNRAKDVDDTCPGDDCRGEEVGQEPCNDRCCPMNGSWGQWSEWNDCSSPCLGTTYRTRECDNPEPDCGGETCIGIDESTRRCNEPWKRPCAPHCDDGREVWNTNDKPFQAYRVKANGAKLDAMAIFSRTWFFMANDDELLIEFDFPIELSTFKITSQHLMSATMETIDENDNIINSYTEGGLGDKEGDLVFTPTAPVEEQVKKLRFTFVSTGSEWNIRASSASVCQREEFCEWDPWTPWTPCTKTCNRGEQLSIRGCQCPPPGAYGTTPCVGEDTRTKACFITTCTPPPPPTPDCMCTLILPVLLHRHHLIVCAHYVYLYSSTTIT